MSFKAVERVVLPPRFAQTTTLCRGWPSGYDLNDSESKSTYKHGGYVQDSVVEEVQSRSKKKQKDTNSNPVFPCLSLTVL